MQFEIVTLFPEIFDSVLKTSLLGKAIADGRLSVRMSSPREVAPPPHHSVDDTPYGGGPGMVMRADTLVTAIERVEAERGRAHKILMCPTGRPLTQSRVRELAQHDRVLIVCGRYEGYDERVRGFVDEEISLGDFVLSGGELGAMVIIDAVSRCIDGVLGNRASTEEESHEAGLLEYPQYTRPAEFRGQGVPAALVSGNHERIRRWRRYQSLVRTRAKRPDLFERFALTAEDRKLLAGEEP